MSFYPYQDKLAPVWSPNVNPDKKTSSSNSGSGGGGWLSSVNTNSDIGNVPTYNLPAFQSARPLPNIKVPTYKAPGELNLPTFDSPSLDEYIKNIDIPGVKVDVPTIDNQFIKEKTQEYAAPTLSEERQGFREALLEARKYSDNPAVVAKVIRDIMRGRGTNISKVLGSAGQTATNLEASNRANQMNANINNANLEQARNLTKVKAETEIANKEIAERNERKYAEAMDLYQKVVADMLNQRNLSSSFDNQAAMSQYDKLMADAMSQRAAEQAYINNAAIHSADQNFAAQMAAWEEDAKQGNANGTRNNVASIFLPSKKGSIGYPGNTWMTSANP